MAYARERHVYVGFERHIDDSTIILKDESQLEQLIEWIDVSYYDLLRKRVIEAFLS